MVERFVQFCCWLGFHTWVPTTGMAAHKILQFNADHVEEKVSASWTCRFCGGLGQTYTHEPPVGRYRIPKVKPGRHVRSCYHQDFRVVRISGEESVDGRQPRWTFHLRFAPNTLWHINVRWPGVPNWDE